MKGDPEQRPCAFRVASAIRLPVRLVLFDIDGTLLVGNGAGGRAMEYAGRKVLGPAFSIRGIDFAGALDPWIYREAARLQGFHAAEALHDEFREVYLARLPQELSVSDPRPRILPGVATLLSLLGTRSDVTLGLVTGNYARAAPLKLRSVGIQPEQFVLGAFGDDGPTRPALVELALERWRGRGASVAADRVVVVGDTPRDIDCARKNGCRAFAVATGAYGREELADHAPDILATDLSDPRPLLALLDGD